MNHTVADLDPVRYSGKWYELAKYPFLYQADCDNAAAIYRWDDMNQKLLIENQCYKNGQKIRSRHAKAWIPDQSNKGKLRILFEGEPRDPEGDYWVHYTDYDNYAVVGGPSGRVLWLLGRKPTITYQDVNVLLDIIRKFGYDTDKLLANPGTVV